MKCFFIIFLMFCLVAPVYSGSFYVVNPDGKVVAKCNYIPSQSDIESRNETAIYSEEDIPLHEAVVKNKKIQRKVKTAQELSQEQKKKEKAVEEAFVKEKMRQLAIDQLKAEGHVFKYIDKEE